MSQPPDMFTRAVLALLIGLPIATVANVIGYWITMITLTIFLGCIAPPWAIEALAFLEFCAAMLYSVIALFLEVVDP